MRRFCVWRAGRNSEEISLLRFSLARVAGESGSAPGEDGTEACVGQDARDGVTVITLNLDPSFFHGASRATRLLHFFRQSLFFGLTDSDKSCDDGYGLTAPMRSRTKNIHSSSLAFWCACRRIGWNANRRIGWGRRQCHILRRRERTLPWKRPVTYGNVFFLFHPQPCG